MLQTMISDSTTAVSARPATAAKSNATVKTVITTRYVPILTQNTEEEATLHHHSLEGIHKEVKEQDDPQIPTLN